MGNRSSRQKNNDKFQTTFNPNKDEYISEDTTQASQKEHKLSQIHLLEQRQEEESKRIEKILCQIRQLSENVDNLDSVAKNEIYTQLIDTFSYKKTLRYFSCLKELFSHKNVMDELITFKLDTIKCHYDGNLDKPENMFIPYIIMTMFYFDLPNYSQIELNQLCLNIYTRLINIHQTYVDNDYVYNQNDPFKIDSIDKHFNKTDKNQFTIEVCHKILLQLLVPKILQSSIYIFHTEWKLHNDHIKQVTRNLENLTLWIRSIVRTLILSETYTCSISTLFENPDVLTQIVTTRDDELFRKCCKIITIELSVYSVDNHQALRLQLETLLIYLCDQNYVEGAKELLNAVNFDPKNIIQIYNRLSVNQQSIRDVLIRYTFSPNT